MLIHKILDSNEFLTPIADYDVDFQLGRWSVVVRIEAAVGPAIQNRNPFGLTRTLLSFRRELVARFVLGGLDHGFYVT